MEARTILWFMLFLGVIVHTIVLSNINIAMTEMTEKTKENSIVNNECPKHFVETLKNSSVPKVANNNTKNYIHLVLPIEKKLLLQERFNWTESQQNLILSSHYAVYGTAQLFGGVLCHKYGAKKVWGFANLLLGLSSFLAPSAARIDYIVLIYLRLLQGILAGLGIAGPTQLVAKWVPPHDRAKYLTTLLGYPFGISISYSLYGYVISWWGWQYTFYLSGLFVTVWCILCKLLIYDTPTLHPRISIVELKYIKSFTGHTELKKKLPIPWKSILTSRPFLINISAKWGVMWALSTLSIYIPKYLSKIHGLPIEKNGILSGFPFLLKVIYALGFSAFTDYLLFKNMFSRTNVRKFAVLISGVIGGSFLLGIPLAGCNTMLAIILLGLTMTLNGGVSSGVIPNMVDMSPNFTGILEGVAGFVTTFTGFLSPLVVNFVVVNNTIQEWNIVFIIVGLMYVVPGIFFVLFADSEVQPWNDPPVKSMSKECNFLNPPTKEEANGQWNDPQVKSMSKECNFLNSPTKEETNGQCINIENSINR